MHRTYWALPGELAGRPSPELIPWRIEQLLASGIGGVVSLDGPIRVKDLSSAGIKHLAVYRPMLLLHHRSDQERFLTVMPKIIPFVDSLRQEGRAALLHCYYGCDRSGCAICCYLVAREGMTAEQAIAHIQKINPDALWAPGYMETVHTFEELFHANPSSFGIPCAD